MIMIMIIVAQIIRCAYYWKACFIVCCNGGIAIRTRQARIAIDASIDVEDQQGVQPRLVLVGHSEALPILFSALPTVYYIVARSSQMSDYAWTFKRSIRSNRTVSSLVLIKAVSRSTQQSKPNILSIATKLLEM